MKWFSLKFLFIFILITSNSLITIHSKSSNKFLVNKNKMKQSYIIDDVFKKLINYNDIIQKVTDEKFINDILNNKSKHKIDFDRIEINEIIQDKDKSSNEINQLKEDLTEIIKEDNRNTKGVVDHTINYIFTKNEVNVPFYKHKQIINEVYDKILSKIENLENPSSFLEIASSFNPDADPPKPYTSNEIMCKNSLDCMLKKLLYQKCSVARVNIRTIYEVVNVIFHIMAKIIFLLCACVAVPAGESITIQCMNTNAQPGLICVNPNMVFKGVFKISIMLWKIYELMSTFCWNPIGP